MFLYIPNIPIILWVLLVLYVALLILCKGEGFFTMFFGIYLMGVWFTEANGENHSLLVIGGLIVIVRFIFALRTRIRNDKEKAKKAEEARIAKEKAEKAEAEFKKLKDPESHMDIVRRLAHEGSTSALSILAHNAIVNDYIRREKEYNDYIKRLHDWTTGADGSDVIDFMDKYIR